MKTITVFGATGSQGGSVARALLENGTFNIRVVTRDPDSSKAKSLECLGAEIFQGDLNDKESVKRAVRNSYGCYLVTNWIITDMEHEINQGKNVADACKEEGVHHLVFSTLPGVQKSLGFTVRHFDSKAIVDDYMDSINLKRTRLVMCFYFENFLRRLNKEGDNEYIYEMPFEGSLIPMISVDDIGKIVCQIFLAGDKYIDKSVPICGDTKTVNECFNIFNKYLAPRNIKDKEAKIADWRAHDNPIDHDFANFCEYMTKRPHKWDHELTKEILPEVLTFEEWVMKNRESIGILLDCKT